MTPEEYLLQRLLKADCTSYDNDGIHEIIVTEDGCARLSPSHTLQDWDMRCFSNIDQTVGKMPDLEFAMGEFYKNSLYAKEPLVADTIIRNVGFKVPSHLPLRSLLWPHNSWFIFSSKTGLLSNKWWHIYGYVRALADN